MKIEDDFCSRTRTELFPYHLWDMDYGLFIVCSDNTMDRISRWCKKKGIKKENFNVQEYLADGNPYDFAWGKGYLEDGLLLMEDADTEKARTSCTILFDNYNDCHMLHGPTKIYRKVGSPYKTRVRVELPLVFKGKHLEDRYRFMLRFNINVGSIDFKTKREASRYYNWVESHLHPLPF